MEVEEEAGHHQLDRRPLANWAQTSFCCLVEALVALNEIAAEKITTTTGEEGTTTTAEVTTTTTPVVTAIIEESCRFLREVSAVTEPADNDSKQEELREQEDALTSQFETYSQFVSRHMHSYKLKEWITRWADDRAVPGLDLDKQGPGVVSHMRAELAKGINDYLDNNF